MNGSSPNPRLRPFHPVAFGRYTLLLPLATGGMGEIFLARLGGTAGFEKFCVIKKVLPALARDRAFVERFTGEARVLVRLTHGSIAQVLDMGDVDGDPYMALEFVDGKDLRRVLSRQREAGKPLPVAVALYVMGKVLEALAYAHRKRDEQDREIQLVHRDISPQNILLSYEGEVKVIDFGLAKSTLSDAKTNPSIILGKFLYMAPEQARHEKVDRRSDLYAVAMCLYEMLAGRHPFGQLGMTALMEAVMRPKVQPLKELAPHVPDEVCQLVDRGLEVDPARRFQAADEMRGQLMAALLKLDPSVGPERISAHMREAFAGEYGAERRLLQQLREVAAAPAAAPPDTEAPWEATAVRRPAPASATETAEALVAAPLTAPPRSRVGDDKTVPGVRLEDLEREAADGPPTPEQSLPSLAAPSMLDEEPHAYGGLTPPPTLVVQPPQQPDEPEEPPASIEVSPELFADVEDDAAFRPGVKRYPEPDTGRLELPVLGSGHTPPTGLMEEPLQHNTVVMEMPRPPGSTTGPMGAFTPRSGSATGPAEVFPNETPRGGVVTGPGSPVTGEQPRSWAAPVTAPSEVVGERRGGRGLVVGAVVGVLALGGGAAFWMLRAPAPKVAPRSPPRAEQPPPAPSPVPERPMAELPAPPPPPVDAPTPPSMPDPVPAPAPEAEPAPTPTPAAAPPVRPVPPRPVAAAPGAKVPGRSDKQAVDQAWARLTDRMDGLELACGGNEPKMDKLRSRYSAIGKAVHLDDRDDADLLKRISNLMDAINECALP